MLHIVLTSASSSILPSFPLAPRLSPSASECALISFNVSAFVVDELNILVVPFGLVIGMLRAPCLVVALKPGVSSSMTTEQGAFGQQNGLWIFQSLRRQIRLGLVWR